MSCGGDKPKQVEFQLPLIDYDFAGTVDEIVRFEEGLGSTFDKARSNDNNLVFTSPATDFPERIYKLSNGRIAEIYIPCTNEATIKALLPRLGEELKAKSWNEWPTPVKNGKCDAAYLLTRKINNQVMQIGSAIIHTKTNSVEKTTPGMTFIFSRTDVVDINKAKMPEIYFEALEKTKDEIEAYFKKKGDKIEVTGRFIKEAVDNPAFGNEFCFFFPDSDNICEAILMTTSSFLLNSSENLANQLKALGFAEDKRDNLMIFFYNESKDIWAQVRIYPANQFTQPNILFARTLS